MEAQERHQRAERKVKELKAFYGNLVGFVLVNVLLVVINLVTSLVFCGSIG